MSGTMESIIVGVATGLIVVAIGLLIERVPRRVTMLMALGISLIAFVLWPRAALVEVPDLSDLSRDEAVLKLSSVELVGAAEPQAAPNTRPEHVVPMSQNLLPGTKVHRGSVVRYSVSTPTSVVPGLVGGGRDSAAAYSISVFSPSDGGDVIPKRGADSIFRFEVEGTIEGVDLTKSSVLVWVQPIDPPSDQPGWYLQRLPANGIRSVSGTRWRGVCQIGNQQYPPHEGDVVEVAASVVPAEESARLVAREGPLTVLVLPGVVSQVVRLTVRFK